MEREGMEGWEMGLHEKYPHNATYFASGDASWVLAPHVILLENSFHLADGMPLS